MQRHPFVARASESKSIWLLRDHVTPLIGSEQTGGELAMAVTRTLPGEGTPPHIHRNEDEAFFVLEGEMTFMYRDTLLKAPAGSFVWGPRDVIHCFRNTTDKPTTMLLLVTPTEFLKFSATLGEPALDFGSPPQITPEKIGKLMEIAPKYGMEILPEHPMPTVITPIAPPHKRVWAMGLDVSYLLTSDQTGGRFTVIDIRSTQGGGPPPHAHEVMDEMFYVVEGEYDFVLGDGRVEKLGPGDACFVPHGTRHQFTHTNAGPGQLIDIHTPGGFEKFFDEIGAPYEQHATPPAMPEEALAALLGRHGMTV